MIVVVEIVSVISSFSQPAPGQYLYPSVKINEAKKFNRKLEISIANVLVIKLPIEKSDSIASSKSIYGTYSRR